MHILNHIPASSVGFRATSQSLKAQDTAPEGPVDLFYADRPSSEVDKLLTLAALSRSASVERRAGNAQVLDAGVFAQEAALAAIGGPHSTAFAGGDKKEILALFDQWNQALQTKDPNKVVDLYAPDAILLPTVSNRVRHNHEEIKDYFDHFLEKGPKGKIDESNIRFFGDAAINSGVYTFNFANGDTVQARYTFVYAKREDQWKIVEHHSSAMPEKKPH